MRPLRLDLHGFTVFRDWTTIDFTDADFFALVGPTGSGKSTVLDAVCFALYGTVPRWGDRRGVAGALSPSATEARVRLVFESGGARYAATRVVRRDGKGRVTTGLAGLEELPRGFDLSRLDAAPGEAAATAPGELGTVLAGTPGEMDAAVLEVVGLPYEQFTTCVVLPQGEFAEFLHAKPAQRQQILVNLLGLSVYEKVRNRATALAAEADAKLAGSQKLRAELADATDEAVEAAGRAAATQATLVDDVATQVPRLRAALAGAERARAAVSGVDTDLDRLDRVRRPADVAEVTGRAEAARLAAEAAGREVALAEEREEKLRGELSGAADPADLRRLLDGYAERDELTVAGRDLAATLDAARAAAGVAATAVAEARAEVESAGGRVGSAEAAVEAARTADAAAALRVHLRAGEPCPVCTATVAQPPPVPDIPALRAATTELADARRAADAAAKTLARAEREARERDRAADAAQARHDHTAGRIAELTARLAGAPDPAALREQLSALSALWQALEDASGVVRAAREDQRRAAAAAQRAQARLAEAWRAFDTARDAVATLAPPPADRDDLAAAWSVLADWAGGRAGERRAERDRLEAEAGEADAAVAEARHRLADLFTAAGQNRPPADYPVDGFEPAAAKFAALATAAHERAVERRDQAARLDAERAGHERDAQVARALAQHLRANNFERWLLEEALDALVDGASRILRELSGGQYDLVHDKGDFAVVDHHDAALRRPVRTLSGGETFQASLALALALSEQLGDMSTSAASLESIVLDEGFGTLDASTLDTVAATLEALAAKGDRMVGVVTHVGALAERIPVRFEVRKDARTARVERVGL
jgi:exonuclease SbcC